MSAMLAAWRIVTSLLVRWGVIVDKLFMPLLRIIETAVHSTHGLAQAPDERTRGIRLVAHPARRLAPAPMGSAARALPSGAA